MNKVGPSCRGERVVIKPDAKSDITKAAERGSECNAEDY